MRWAVGASREFRNGIVPKWETLLFLALSKILQGLCWSIVLYWESLVTNETGYELLFFLMCGYLAREFQFGT
jgi:hypothetical protein